MRLRGVPEIMRTGELDELDLSRVARLAKRGPVVEPFPSSFQKLCLGAQPASRAYPGENRTTRAELDAQDERGIRDRLPDPPEDGVDEPHAVGADPSVLVGALVDVGCEELRDEGPISPVLSRSAVETILARAGYSRVELHAISAGFEQHVGRVCEALDNVVDLW